MKKIKELQIKAEDLRRKVKTYCADQTHETPVYENQKDKINEWTQGHSDVLKEILKLRVAIQKTNIQTNVTIELDGKQVTKSIAEWIHRRRDLAGLEQSMWNGIGDKGLQEGTIKSSTGEPVEVKIRRYYDPETRDKNVEIYRTEPSTIDSNLEVTNAITEIAD